MAQKFLVFDVSAPYGHFKKPYTTTSPLTYSIPTRTAVAGMIAAILGFGKEDYQKLFTKDLAQIGIGIRKPIKKVRISENLINTKKSMNRIHERTQIKIEYLKDVCYRIYFTHKDEKIYGKLKEFLTRHCSVYTISMGLSENLANYTFVGEFEGQEISGNKGFVEFSSVLPVDRIAKGDVEYEDDREYFTENIPVEMDEERNVKEYREILFERNSRKIKAKLENFTKIMEIDENIMIL
ncbi:type I-B CRISPR-associated protein Cas5b [Acetivibrio clariflavus]|uniref:type I-B CRISPR-associated protein Cas5b n=1 Tax=Acetivibrio clariflavus TaxID=288965 RepID=UPI000483B76C|nr:type I-B CRISPR-associated protein Cas5b [Acetivibrio clariflavus]HOQ02123.1 type I-B CRISPR-associated protein Cas5b [Acetivibrio clariflavus]HPU42251.1 type I-B CRISPR-associated protein Cas5b [Acetivibrio clariflavus]